MVKKAEQQRMLDYVVAELKYSGEEITPIRKNMVGGLESNIILVGDDGIVLMVDKIYSKKRFHSLYNFLKQEKEHIAAVVFKDGETFFRSAAKENYFKKNKSLSLKNCSDEDMQRMILMTPEEIILADRNSGQIQYFQPESSGLEEGIESFKFKPASFNYDHINEYEKFRPANTDSKKLYIWEKRKHITGPLFLDDSSLKKLKLVHSSLF